MLNFRQRGNDALFLFCGREVHLFGYGSKTEKKKHKWGLFKAGKTARYTQVSSLRHPTTRA